MDAGGNCADAIQHIADTTEIMNPHSSNSNSHARAIGNRGLRGVCVAACIATAVALNCAHFVDVAVVAQHPAAIPTDYAPGYVGTAVWTIRVVGSRGQLQFWFDGAIISGRDVFRLRALPSNALEPFEVPVQESAVAAGGFALQTWALKSSSGAAIGGGRTVSWSATVPSWAVYLLTAGILVAITRPAVVRRWRRRHSRCERCGYDLRASPKRCPECGAVHAGRHSMTTSREARDRSIEINAGDTSRAHYGMVLALALGALITWAISYAVAIEFAAQTRASFMSATVAHGRLSLVRLLVEVDDLYRVYSVHVFRSGMDPLLSPVTKLDWHHAGIKATSWGFGNSFRGGQAQGWSLSIPQWLLLAGGLLSAVLTICFTFAQFVPWLVKCNRP